LDELRCGFGWVLLDEAVDYSIEYQESRMTLGKRMYESVNQSIHFALGINAR
jgi:predicted exporter